MVWRGSFYGTFSFYGTISQSRRRSFYGTFVLRGVRSTGYHCNSFYVVWERGFNSMSLKCSHSVRVVPTGVALLVGIAPHPNFKTHSSIWKLLLSGKESTFM